MNRQFMLVVMASQFTNRIAVRGRWRTALHESAHTVIGIVLGFPIAEVSIQADDLSGTNGHTCLGKEKTPSIGKCESDRRKIVRLAFEECVQTPGPCRWRAVLSLIRKLQKVAAALVQQSWQVIRLFAVDLMNLGTIPGTVATSTIRELLEAQDKHRAGLPFTLRDRWLPTAAMS